MDKRNSCYTYFAIKGDFNPDDITRLLELTPTNKWHIGDLRRNGTAYDFAQWEFGHCDKYDVITENQMMCTIKHLVPKIDLLKGIKKAYNISFVLDIVPSIYPGELTPCLAPNRAVIEFCYLTETNIDIDLYVYDSNETTQ